MRLPFRKMHGIGNDFVVLDARRNSVLDARRNSMPDARGNNLPDARAGLRDAAAIARLGDRHRGVGFDQLITLEDDAQGADVFLRFHNSDGSEAGACGNGTRCAASLVLEETGRARIAIRTRGGILAAQRLADGTVQVDMGPPRLGWQDVPLAREMDTLHVPMAGLDGAACSMGNPHVTFFEDGLDAAALGPALERDPLLPDRANIGFARVEAPDRIRLVVWERGAGLTLACGSGACAAIVNAHRRGLCGRAATIAMPGGELQLEWRAADGHVLMAGPVATAFTGEVAV
ncbi:diaminopimelate epimerase [Roseococcus sp. DSY-14]|uniref:diaminopimelate epimerase n=1 Tax=Roseococcus sp. DSY-14 TaxID=3369650 RepID=UPI00387AF5A0